jgi:hypothetical protein
MVVLLGSLSLGLHSIVVHAHPPRAHLKATSPSSHTAMAPSLLSSSLSRVRSSSPATVNVAIAPGGGESLHQSASRNQRRVKRQAEAIIGVE